MHATQKRAKPARNCVAIPVGRQMRFLSLRADPSVAPIDIDARTASFTFSSEEPVSRWFGNEVLSHKNGAPDLSRLNDGANLLFNHNWDDVIGVVENASVKNSRGYCTVRFAKTARGDEMLGMVADGILRNVSFAYQVESYTEDGSGSPDDPDDATYTATRWMAYEISLVTVPADQTVGIGRNSDAAEQEIPVIRSTPAPIVVPQSPAPAENLKGFTMSTVNDTAAPAVDIKAIQETARKAERERATEIVAMCERIGVDVELTRKLVNEGVSLEEAQRQVLANLPQQRAIATSADVVDMSEKEKNSWSLVRAINAVLNNDWSKAGFEREASTAIAKQSGREIRNGSFFMPSNIPFMAKGASNRAIYSVGAAAQGGNLVATNLLAGSFIEVLRNISVTGQLGATYLTGLVGKVDIPRRITATPTYWVGESGAITEGESTFDKVSLTPKTIASLSKMSRLALMQTTPDIEMLARSDLLAVMVLGLDLAALSGTGASNQPLGIVNQSGVGSVIGGTNGANLSFDNLISLKYGVKVANAVQANLGFAMNSKSIGYLSTIKSTTGQYIWDPQGGLTANSPDKVKGSPYAESQQLRSNLTKGASTGICSEIIYGNWSELLIGEWGVMEMMVNPFDTVGFANGDVIIRAMQTADVQLRHAASFSVMSDALTPGF